MSESVQTGAGATKQKVRTETSATAGEAKQAASQVAGTAAEQARGVAGEARQQAGSALGDLRSRAMGEADEQTRRAAGRLRQWSSDLSGLAAHARDDSPARGLVAQAADTGSRAADYLEEQGVEGLVGDLQHFARRRPGAFLGGALLAGLAVGRLGKAAQASGNDGDGNDAGDGRTGAVTDRGAVRPGQGQTVRTGPPAISAEGAAVTPPAGPSSDGAAHRGRPGV
ncbi:hypothetical protein ACFUMJ_12030 [Streptomyces olivaceus]|uniref:hypothetical protein n=1 Tax=Streptomyces TaxID=1883 RepID=UPI001FB6AAD9|nr:hypothetical protein [Streptomyces sp. CB09030]UOG82740.1 hypothetical protein L6J92_27660 [Streptomyces sp. CB09030]